MRRAALLCLLLLASTPALASEPARARDAVAEAGLLAGVSGWTTSYGKTDAVLVYGVHGGWMPLDWLEVIGIADHARRSFDPANLHITNTETWLQVGPRFFTWVEFLRFFGEVTAGGVLRSVSYHDDLVADSRRTAFGFGVGGGMTVTIAERLGIALRGTWRHRDDRSNILVTLDVSWFFQSP